MLNKTPYTESDKLINVKNWIKAILLSQNIIDNSGNILNIDKYKETVDNEINKRELALIESTNPDGVVVDKDFTSVLFGEIAFLKKIKNYTKNIDPLTENPLELRANTVTSNYGLKDLTHDVKIINQTLFRKVKKHLIR